MEVIKCHDCKRSAYCPHCGSKEPAGPYQFSKREARKFRSEDKNDNYLVRTTILIGFLGMLYGIVVGRKSGSESTWYVVQSAVIVMNAALYGFLGVLLGVPVAATINIFRTARHFLIPVLLVLLFLAYEFGFLKLQ